MARRVGFGDKPERGKSTADAYLDEFRAKGRQKRAAKTATHAARPKRHWFVIVFLGIWLALWTFGIVMAGILVLSGEKDSFLLIWLLFASIGWIAVVLVLRRLIRGKPKDG